MNFPIFINKFIITNKYIRYTPFYYWFLLINHDNWRFDDYQRYWDFWLNINHGWDTMQYKWEYYKVFGKVHK